MAKKRCKAIVSYPPGKHTRSRRCGWYAVIDGYCMKHYYSILNKESRKLPAHSKTTLKKPQFCENTPNIHKVSDGAFFDGTVHSNLPELQRRIHYRNINSLVKRCGKPIEKEVSKDEE